MRVLYVAGEVAPFTELTDAARLIRTLPEALQEHCDVEPRIMMPRYGVVSERKNRLHEVIRLSGAEIPVGDETETLAVKVASIPGIRLQVYFMDNDAYFKRKGVHKHKKSGELFKDNPARALFFARAALETAKTLHWDPAVIHASGWMAAFVPHLLDTEYVDEELFAETESAYTPDVLDDYTAELTAEEAAALHLPDHFAGRTLREIGLSTAGTAVYAGDDAPADGEPDGPTLDPSADLDTLAESAGDVYTALTGVPLAP